MATTKGQRVGIAIILAVTVIGTIGSFAVMILSAQNSAKQDAQQQKDYADYQAKYEEYQKKLDAQTSELSTKYFATFSQYASRVGEFDLDSSNKDLKTEDIVVGDGSEITDTSNFGAYYIGWLPSGKIFDQSIDNSTLKAPLTVTGGLSNASLIDGWKEGMKGMKIGGVREMTLPSDKAYGETGSTDSSGNQTIPPNTPLKFIVMAIPLPETISAPEYPASLLSGSY